MTLQKAFLGEGWAWPMGLDENGLIQSAQYEDDIAQAVRIILATNPGERIMRPTFGAGLNDFLFEPINSTTLSLIENRVRESLIDWEARIDVILVKVTAVDPKNGKLQIEIQYRVRTTNTLFNLVYPFYLQEGLAR